MNIVLKINNLFKNPYLIVSYLGKKGFLKWLPDNPYLKLLFRAKTGYTLNIKKPKSYNEKLQWLKLYDRNPKYTMMVDKYEVKKYIAEIIGEEYLIPTLKVYDHYSDINFEELPDQFVLKCTHDSGGLVICTNKGVLDYQRALKKIKASYKSNYYYELREWVYKDIKPRIICEEFMDDEEQNNGLTDYKFYCFHGTPIYCQVIKDRETNATIDFFDMEWNHMEFTGLQELPHSKEKINKPLKLNEMYSIAKTLSQGVPFVRVDFYYVNNNVYFGEMTFFPRSGFGRFKPDEWNEKMGKLIDLSKI